MTTALEKWLRLLCGLAMGALLLGAGYAALAPSGPPPLQTIDSPIPRVNLVGAVDGMRDKADTRQITVEYQDSTHAFRAYGELKLQGASSLDYQKKNYNLTLFQDRGHEFRQNVDLGWGEQSRYCLKANWVDKTHARNLVCAQLAAEIQERFDVLPQAPNHGLVDGFPVEVYNNGEFLGLYTWNIPRDDWLLGMQKDHPGHLAMMSHNWNPAAVFEAMPDYDAWETVVGEQNEGNLAKLARLSQFVLESSDQQFREEQAEYFDLDAALNYIILCDFALLVDNCGKNMMMATFDGRYWYPTLYDMDSSFGTDWSGKELYNPEIPSVSSTSYFLNRVKYLYLEELTERYFQLRQDILTKEHVMELFYGFRDQIPQQTWEKERSAWPDAPGFDYDQIEEFLDVHIPALDAYWLQKLEESRENPAS